ncbi:hypothetical protein [Rhodopseudomonas sp. B29]|uniref:hypothetical protein n=1 Tax=Rhodopseudomonas sp. B29 TaxID=95607 RepID=UPI0003B41D16|nr:hypothetical protein [Rhodopseudomonas sp. B29]
MATAPDPYVRYSFTMRIAEARQRARAYFKEFPKETFETIVEHHEDFQGSNIRVTMRRLKVPRPSP